MDCPEMFNFDVGIYIVDQHKFSWMFLESKGIGCLSFCVHYSSTAFM